VYEGVGHLLTRNLGNQHDDYDPDPEKRAQGIEAQRIFLVRLGYIKDSKHCNFASQEFVPGEGIVNANGTCMCSVSTAETTWGSVKALYR